MRSIVFATLIAAGIGFVGASSASAAPAAGAAIDKSAEINSAVVKVQHWRWGSRRWYRCHYRHRSWGRCWW
jgi:hypothetical protein